MNTGPKTYDWKEIFLAAISKVPVINYGCKAAGVHRVTVFRARQTDEEFRLAMDDRMEDGIDEAEIEMMRRAVHGYEEPVLYQGKLSFVSEVYTREDGIEDVRLMRDENGQPVPLTVRKHSDSLLQFALKGRRRGVYGDKTEVTGDGGGPLKFMDETKKASRIAALLELAKLRKDIG